MSEYESNDYEQEKMKQNEEKRRKSRIMQKYYSNGYLLESQALRNGFGKMVRAVNQTNPKYSFGKEKRFFSVYKNDNLPYEHTSLENEKYGNINIGYHNRVINKNKGNANYGGTFNRFDSYSDFNKSNIKNLQGINFVSSSNNATDFYYVPPPTHYYKYEKSPKWGFSKSKRSLYDEKGKYEHYNLPYNRKIDNENIHKKWRTRVIGGDIGLDDRFIENRKFAEDLETPGPGRYNPKDIYFKYSHYPGGYMGMKLDSCEPVKHKNLRNELNSCFNGNEKMRKPIKSNKKFVFHDKIKFDFGKNNHLSNTFSGNFMPRNILEQSKSTKNNKQFNHFMNDNIYDNQIKRNSKINEKENLQTT